MSEVKKPAKCPKDWSLMDTVDVEGVAVDRCPTCGGLWFDLGELRQLLDMNSLQKEDLIRHDETQAHVDVHTRTTPCCPRDGFALAKVHDAQQRHIEYELCMFCGGVFLDGGELRDLSKLNLIERVRAALGR